MAFFITDKYEVLKSATVLLRVRKKPNILSFFQHFTAFYSFLQLSTAFNSFQQLPTAFYYSFLQLSTAFYSIKPEKTRVAVRRRSRVDSTASSGVSTASYSFQQHSTASYNFLQHYTTAFYSFLQLSTAVNLKIRMWQIGGGAE